MNYTILREHDPDRLAQEVEKYTYEGWKPLGGVSVVAPVIEGSPAPLYAQAMIKPGNGDE